MSDRVDDFEDLRVYRTAFTHSMEIFEVSDEWPKEERYALTDQIRRSSRAVCSNIAEAWSKRRYTNHFVSTLSDAEGEAAETIPWLDFAQACGYLPDEEHEQLREEYRKMRGGLIKSAVVRSTAAQEILFFRRCASQRGICPFPNSNVHFCLDAKTNQKDHGGRRKFLTAAPAPLKFFKLPRSAHSGSEEFPGAPSTQQSGRHFLRRPEGRIPNRRSQPSVPERDVGVSCG